jgi:hypothetical protein
VDGADDQTAAFDVSGTRLVFVRDAPDCPMVTEMTMSWLPIKVPGCTQRRISFSLWDLQTRERIAEMVLVKDMGSRMSSPALSAMIGGIKPMNLLLASVPAMRLDLRNPRGCRCPPQRQRSLGSNRRGSLRSGDALDCRRQSGAEQRGFAESDGALRDAVARGTQELRCSCRPASGSTLRTAEGHPVASCSTWIQA